MPSPERTATIVFADLAGSTALFERLGDQVASQWVTQLTAKLSGMFEKHCGRVVKLLGDGVFAVFAREDDAMTACMAIQRVLRDQPMLPDGMHQPLQMQIGVEAGEVVEIDGDCFGDAVNSAARLADLAGAGQIFTSERVRSALSHDSVATLKSLGPLYLRGKTHPMEVYAVLWAQQSDSDVTMVGRSIVPRVGQQSLALRHAHLHKTLHANAGKLSIGRAGNLDLLVDDSRVSRVHAMLQWRSGYFVLEDVSSYGTWVYMGQQNDAVVLRRTDCALVGSGTISLSCAREDANAPCIAFSVSA